MSIFKINNIGHVDLPIFIKDGNNNDMPVTLRPGEFILTDNSTKTRSINIYGRKRLLGIETINKPDHLKLYKTYRKEDFKKELVDSINKKINEINQPQPIAQNISKLVEENDTLQTQTKKVSEDDFLKEVQHIFNNKTLSPYEESKKEVNIYTERYEEDGVIYGVWTDDEITFLKKNYPKHGKKFCVESLKRTENSVASKISSLGLKKRKKRKK